MKKSFLLLIVVLVVATGCGNRQSGGSQSALSTPTYSGVLMSRDGGRTFEPKNYITETTNLSNRDILSFAVSHFDTNILYLGTARGGIYKSIDAGETWTQLDFGPSNVSVIALNAEEPRTVYAGAVWEGRGQVFRSDDEGETWRSIYIEPIEGTEITSLAFGPNDPRTIYLGTTDNEQGFSTIARSRDGGGTWDNVLTERASISRVAFDAKDVNTIYTSTDRNDVLKTRDGGETWVEIRNLERTREQRLYEGRVQSFVAHPREAGILFVGTDRGFFQSNDYGTSWTEIDIIGTSKGLPIRAIAAHPHNNARLIYAAAQAVYGKVDDGWAITDTQSNRNVSTLTYNPLDSEIIYMTFTRGD